ncbi:MAG: hypothetical protein F4X75_21050 [Gemmatimonadetes bacterium]|nr:hypothetical protein [Gemmatimonadota bacterium]
MKSVSPHVFEHCALDELGDEDAEPHLAEDATDRKPQRVEGPPQKSILQRKRFRRSKMKLQKIKREIIGGYYLVDRLSSKDSLER